jgi:hypothetical protein
MKLEGPIQRPLMGGEINGRKVTLLADTGASKSAILRAAAVQMKLHEIDLPGTTFYGVGGGSAATYTFLDTIKVGDFETHRLSMLVVGENPALASGPVAVIGADFWGQADDEIDLAHGVIRMIRPQGCAGDEVLYWNQPFSALKLLTPATSGGEFIVGVTLNGVTLRAELDTGSTRSYVTRQGFAKLHMDWPVAGQGANVQGLGKAPVGSVFVTFDEFAFDEEKIKSPRISVADLFGQDKTVFLGSRAAEDATAFPDMILGADFFGAHRVLIANSQRKVYITYNGGHPF